MANMDTWNPQERLPSSRSRIPSEGLLEAVNAALQTIRIVTITETNKLMYATATVIIERLGYKMRGEIPSMEKIVG